MIIPAMVVMLLCYTQEAKDPMSPAVTEAEYAERCGKLTNHPDPVWYEFDQDTPEEELDRIMLGLGRRDPLDL